MKYAKWLGVGGGTLVVVALLAAGAMNLVFAHQLRQTLAQLKAEGRPLTVGEIRPATILECQNAAPLLDLAANLITNKPVATAIQELVALIKTNQFNIEINTWPPEQRDALPRLIQAPEMQALFAVLSDASQKTGYNCNFRYEDGAPLPMLGSIRQMIQFLSIKAEVTSQNGKVDEAGATVLEGLKLANLLKQEPNLIHVFASIGCDKTLLDCLERISDRMDIPSETSRSLIAELGRHIDPAPFVRSMDGERVCMGMWAYQKCRNESYRNILSEEGIWQPTGFFGTSWLYRITGYHKRDLAIYLTLLSRLQDEFKLPYHQIAATIHQESINSQIPNSCRLSFVLLINMEGIVEKSAGYEAFVQVARVGLALKAFKQVNGAYPDTLALLAPEFLARLPVDPFTGHALVYRKDGDGFFLYSLGPNQLDDNGTPWPPTGKRNDKTPDDIGWKAQR